MKKVFVIACAVMMVTALSLGVCAEELTEAVEETIAEAVEETAVETAEAVTEAQETEVAEMATEAEETAVSKLDELESLLSDASPQQIENIKKYIAYGVESLPFSERAKLMILDHIDVIAWILAAVAFAVFFVFSRLSGKKFDESAKLMTNNAIEIAEEGKKEIEAVRDDMNAIRDEIRKEIETEINAVNDLAENNLVAMSSMMDKILAIAVEKMNEAENAMTEASKQESGLAEATTMMCEVVAYLVEHSHSLPEWERDKMTAIIADGKSKIEEVTARDEADEE